MYGLLEKDIGFITEAAKHYGEIEEILLFGSRAMGNFKKGSDVDIALKGQNVSRTTLRRISDELNEVYPLPYFFDIVNYDDISNEELKKHIDNLGKVIYRKNDFS